MAFLIAVFISNGKLSVSFLISSVVLLISATVFTKFDFAVPSVIDEYFSASASYTVSITFVFTSIFISGCLTITVSQRFTFSRNCEYSGCCHSGSNDTFTVGVSSPNGFCLMYDFAFARSVSSVTVSPSLKKDEKSLMSVFSLAYVSTIGIVISDRVTTLSVSPF